MNADNDDVQLIALRDSINAYKTVSVYYTNDVINNYLSDIELLPMDISSIISLSNIVYGMNNKYEYMMKLDDILVYDQEVDGFTSYEQSNSNINVLLVDALSDDEELGYSQCDDADQSFAVVQYSVF